MVQQRNPGDKEPRNRGVPLESSHAIAAIFLGIAALILPIIEATHGGVTVYVNTAKTVEVLEVEPPWLIETWYYTVRSLLDSSLGTLLLLLGGLFACLGIGLKDNRVTYAGGGIMMAVILGRHLSFTTALICLTICGSVLAFHMIADAKREAQKELEEVDGRKSKFYLNALEEETVNH